MLFLQDVISCVLLLSHSFFFLNLTFPKSPSAFLGPREICSNLPRGLVLAAALRRILARGKEASPKSTWVTQLTFIS